MTAKIRAWVIVLAAAPTAAFGDPPEPPTPPVAHTNQGRTVEDETPVIGMPPPLEIIIGEGRDHYVFIPPDLLGGGSELLRIPDPQPIIVADSYNGGSSFAVTPAPSTLGLLALGGLAMSRRRR